MLHAGIQFNTSFATQTHIAQTVGNIMMLSSELWRSTRTMILLYCTTTVLRSYLVRSLSVPYRNTTVQQTVVYSIIVQ